MGLLGAAGAVARLGSVQVHGEIAVNSRFLVASAEIEVHSVANDLNSRLTADAGI
jgi:hypothetical protein